VQSERPPQRAAESGLSQRSSAARRAARGGLRVRFDRRHVQKLTGERLEFGSATAQ